MIRSVYWNKLKENVDVSEFVQTLGNLTKLLSWIALQFHTLKNSLADMCHRIFHYRLKKHIKAGSTA